MSEKDIMKEDVLGRGAFATVFKAKVKNHRDGVRKRCALFPGYHRWSKKGMSQ